jgi:MFS superfamily sulfate permease-like transporter
MVLVLFFLTTPLAYLPTAALAAILISSALSLFDFASLRRYYNVNRFEFRFALVAMLGVMTAGVLPGVLVAVGLSFLKLLRMASKPRDVVMGLVAGTDDVYSSLEHEGVSLAFPA